MCLQVHIYLYILFPLCAKKSYLTQKQLFTLEETSGNLLTLAKTAIEDATDFDHLIRLLTIKDFATQVVNETHEAIVDKVTNFSAEVTGIVSDKLAPCHPVWAVYTSLYDTFCESVLDGLVSKWQVVNQDFLGTIHTSCISPVSMQKTGISLYLHK